MLEVSSIMKMYWTLSCHLWTALEKKQDWTHVPSVLSRLVPRAGTMLGSSVRPQTQPLPTVQQAA